MNRGIYRTYGWRFKPVKYSYLLRGSHEVRKELGLLEEKLELLRGVGGRGSGSGTAGVRHVRAGLISENYGENNIFNTRIRICCGDFRCYALLANAMATLNASETEAVYVPP